MKRLLVVFLFFVVALNAFAGEKKLTPRYNTVTKTWSAYPEVTIKDIQEVPMDSLLKADTLQNTIPARWTLQNSPLKDDTVTITALVVVPYSADYPNEGLTFTQHGWTMLLHDTGTVSNEWTGILVRVGSGFMAATTGNPGATDTAQARLDGFDAVSAGDIIKMTGWIEEFPSGSMNATTQFRPYPGIAINILSSSNPIPEPTIIPVTDVYEGAFPGGKVWYSRGEKYEASLVTFTNLTVNSYINQTRGTWMMNDQSGNYLSDYDASHFFTFANEANPSIPGDPSFQLPPLGGTIDTISGTLLTVSGGENPRGYRICPLFIGDVVYGISLPTVTTHRRYPVVVSSADTVRIQGRFWQTVGGYPLAQEKLVVSVNNGPWTEQTMSLIGADSTYEALILDGDGNPWPANTSIRYFLKAIDDHGNSRLLANSSTTVANDSSKGFFFYTVLDRPLTIQDVQYTPYSNGRTPYLGGTVSVKGIVTATASDLGLAPLNTGGTNAWYIQDGTAPWSGIWVVKRDSATGAALGALQRGDSVTITGNVQENFDVTRILDSLVTIHSSGNPVPQPVTISTGTFGPASLSGDPDAEPYEGMLVRMVGAQVSDVNPVFADGTEWAIDDGSGPAIVRRDGLNSYSNQPGDTASSKKILHVSDRVDTLIGIAYFSFNRYKIDPRLDNDFVVGDPYQYRNGWNMVSVGREQLPSSTGYDKTVLFPTASSSAYYFNSGYFTDATLDPGTGYWIKMPSAQTVRQLGQKLTSLTIPVVAGWNLVGTVADSVDPATVTTLPAGNNLSVFYEYAGGYNVASKLRGSKGYWVKSDSVGSITIESSGMIPRVAPVTNLSEFNSLTITDKSGSRQTLYFVQDAEGKIALRNYELPPSAPGKDGIDARFTSGRSLETYPDIINTPREFSIAVRAQQAPVTLSWNIVTRDGKQFAIREGDGKSITIDGTGSMKLAGSGETQLRLTITGGKEMPREFSLGQNYPNPFNPSTTFRVGLPDAAHLEVGVYNVLGQKVATLVNEVREPGYYDVTWHGLNQDGTQSSSGVYFVRMTAKNPSSAAEGFVSVRKMMLLK